MPKITFMGAGSTVFAKNILGDSLLTPALQDSHIALYDIHAGRLEESRKMLETINTNINSGKSKISSHLGVDERRDALSGADYVVNAIQVGGYEPSTVIDFEIPKKYGLRQTIADTLGIGGIFRSLRTIPVLMDFAQDIEAVCPDALFLNYSNPMAMLTGALLSDTGVKAVGLCHSVQGCARSLLRDVGMDLPEEEIKWHVAGINHMAWLLEVSSGGKDLYPAIKTEAAKRVADGRKDSEKRFGDMVRLEIMRNFGYYVTESSEHNAEYMPYWIKRTHPELIDEFSIPLDEYPRRCVNQIAQWKEMSRTMVDNPDLSHSRTAEYGSYIMEAVETGVPYRIHGNILNTGFITNLPAKACVEIPCLVDKNGVQGCYVGELPEQCAALNRTNINPQLLTIEANRTRKRETVYQAAMLDPHTSAELSIDEIRNLCDDLFDAHGDMMPSFT
jgi:alpha-galactosidase